MAIYYYQGRKERSGELVTGMREVVSHTQLGQDLLQEGILLTNYKKKEQKIPLPSFGDALFRHVPILERVLFARYFSLMLRAGLDVKQSLQALLKQTRSKPLKEALGVIVQKVDQGSGLSESMTLFPLAFSPMFISFIKVGEATGRLQESLSVLAEQLQKDYELRRAVRGGLMYPSVIVTALISTGIAMLIFVVPRLAEVFSGFNVDLPLPTRILIGTGQFFTVYWWLAISLMVALVMGGWFAYRMKPVRNATQMAFLYVPTLGTIMQQVNLARFCRNLSSLLKSGMSFVEALDIIASNTSHPGYASLLKGAKEYVKQGKPLSEYLAGHERLFPPLVVNVAKVGEETGELDTVLRELALFYEGEVESVMKNMTSIIEPILMVVVGLAVGALALAVIAPIYDLVNVI